MPSSTLEHNSHTSYVAKSSQWRLIIVIYSEVSDIRKTFEYVVKSSKVSLKFEWKRMKGLNSKNKLWNMNSFKSGIAN